METEVNAFNTISIATWGGAKAGGPNENRKLSISDLALPRHRKPCVQRGVLSPL